MATHGQRMAVVSCDRRAIVLAVTFTAVSYPFIGHAPAQETLAGVPEEQVLMLRVFLANDDGDRVSCTALGRSTDEAVANAVEFANQRGGCDSFAMDEYEAA